MLGYTSLGDLDFAPDAKAVGAYYPGGMPWTLGFNWTAANTGGNTNKAGSTAPTAPVVKSTRRPMTGAIASSSTLINLYEHIAFGAEYPNGNHKRQTRYHLTGIITEAGVVIPARAVFGSTTPAGIIDQNYRLVRAGSVASQGTLSRRIPWSYGNGIWPIRGAVTHQVVSLRSGVQASVGVLVRLDQLHLVGVVTSAGVFAYLNKPAPHGAVAPAGTIVILTRALRLGNVGLVGVEHAMPILRPAGIIASQGVKVDTIYRALLGAVGPAGIVPHAGVKYLFAQSSPAAVRRVLTAAVRAGAIVPTGIEHARFTSGTLQGVTALTGLLRGRGSPYLTGLLNSLGVHTQRTNHPEVVALAPTGLETALSHPSFLGSAGLAGLLVHQDHAVRGGVIATAGTALIHSRGVVLTAGVDSNSLLMAWRVNELVLRGKLTFLLSMSFRDRSPS